MLGVGLAVDENSALSFHQVTVRTHLLHCTSGLERSEGTHKLRRGSKHGVAEGHGLKSGRTEARKRPSKRGCDSEHLGLGCSFKGTGEDVTEICNYLVHGGENTNGHKREESLSGKWKTEIRRN